MSAHPPSAISINRDALDQLRGLSGESGSDLLDELIDLFASNTADTLARLRASVESAEAARLAHSIAGSALTLGASDIAMLARRMENLAKDSQLTLLPPLIADTDALLPPTIARLRLERG